jgi:hypothetical protein
MSELSDLIARHCHRDTTTTALPRLTLARSGVITRLSAVMYHPALCVLAQGRKRIFLGHQEFCYDPNSYLVASADLPARGQVMEAPCSALMLALDPGTLAALLLEMPTVSPQRTPSKAMAVNQLENDLLDPLLRLLRLLDRPQDIPVLAPLIEREILYRLLCGPRGEMLRQLALPGSQLSQVSRAIHLIRQRYDQKIRMDELARAAGMSTTSFHLFPPAFPRHHCHEPTPVSKAHPPARSAPSPDLPGRERRTRQLRRGLRKRFTVQSRVSPAFWRATRPRCDPDTPGAEAADGRFGD